MRQRQRHRDDTVFNQVSESQPSPVPNEHSERASQQLHLLFDNVRRANWSSTTTDNNSTSNLQVACLPSLFEHQRRSRSVLSSFLPSTNSKVNVEHVQEVNQEANTLLTRSGRVHNTREGQHTQSQASKELTGPADVLCLSHSLAVQTRSLSGVPTDWESHPLNPIPGDQCPF